VIQRASYQITARLAKGGTGGLISLEVAFNGEYRDKTDALLMIADAWTDAMRSQGLDPVKSISSMQFQAPKSPGDRLQ
jgi:hypothetical protein